MTVNLDSWMHDMYDIIKNKQLNRIYMIGTHDSCSSNVMFNISAPNISGPLNFVTTSPVKYLIEPWINNWTITQEWSILNQLLNGVRFLDVRIANIGGIIYVAHTFACSLFQSVLDQIKQFNKRFPNEVVIIELTYDYGHETPITNPVADQIVQNIITTFGTSLMKVSPTLPTYADSLTSPIVLIFDNPRFPAYCWSPIFFNSRWFNVTDSVTLIAQMNAWVNTLPLSNNFNVLSCVLTPDGGTVAKGVFLCCCAPSSLEEFNITGQMTTIIANNKNMSKVSVVSVDYPTPELIRYVINMNKP